MRRRPRALGFFPDKRCTCRNWIAELGIQILSGGILFVIGTTVILPMIKKRTGVEVI